jgi:hypothetical protein
MANYIKGALIEFVETFLVSVPNVILFQFNPESITHTWTAAVTAAVDTNPMAVKEYPQESFSFTIAMDAGDQIADGSELGAGLARASGVHTRLAALEMLQYPVKAKRPAGGSKRTVPKIQVPTVLFVWGPDRVVPVRVTSLTITETLYDGLLNPTHAEAVIGLRVLTAGELAFVTGPLQHMAVAAGQYSQQLRERFARQNLVNATESVIGLVP